MGNAAPEDGTVSVFKKKQCQRHQGLSLLAAALLLNSHYKNYKLRPAAENEDVQTVKPFSVLAIAC
jgi:hypothetical protein